MPKGKGGHGYYDDDDFDDGYDDWEEDYYEEPEYVEPAAAQSASERSNTAASAGASALGRALCDPPPPFPNGKPQPAGDPVRRQEAERVVLASRAMEVDHEQEVFGFLTASPDDVVLAARKLPSGLAQVSEGPPLESAPQAQQAADTSASQQPQTVKPPTKAKLSHSGKAAPHRAVAPKAPSQRAAGVTTATDGVAGLSIADSQKGGSDPAALPASALPARRERRPYSEFVQDPALTKAFQEADAAESAAAGGRSRLHLVVLGHVDAGKSTLMGRLLADLGVVSQKHVHKSQTEAARAGKASFSWAWLLDERPEERARGVTVDVATARFDTPGRAVVLLDAPGHRDFVPNMIAGAAQADAALLVVDGSPGGFESGFSAPVGRLGAGGGGQTREHAQLAKSLGVDQLAVVVTKLDTCDYDSDRFHHIKSVLGPFLKSCGFRDSAVRWLPASAPDGQNMTSPPQAPQLATWWHGPTVVDVIDTFAPGGRAAAALPLRMCVSDLFRTARGQSLVGGKIEGGGLKAGTAVAVVPGGQSGTVKVVEVAGAAVPCARAGDTVDVHFNGVDTQMVAAGAVVCHQEWPVPLVDRFLARVLVLEPPIPLLQGQQVTVHAHSTQETGVVSRLVTLLDTKTGQPAKSRPRCLLKGQTAVVEVTVSRPVPLEEYSDYRALGRVALRDGGRTLAVGVVAQLLQWQ
mmetsp:Transcript_11558/g.34681  ORF Transcript_11558/g.34681 Transcript_11558/m.34681 type:complete len:692 (+) Transcript_11558:117-2192(+)